MSDDPPRNAPARPIWVVACCFLLSGFAALLYETAWLREFSVLFGTSEQALSVVLGAYMGGLSLGAVCAWKLERRVRNPVRIYGLLELGIALSALAAPLVLKLARTVQVSLFASTDAPPEAGDPIQILFSLIAATLAMIVPTTLMGATLPLLAKHIITTNDHLGPRLAVLYALNTLGAVIGTLTAAFVLLPSIGLRQTLLVGVGINLLIFVIIWWHRRHLKTDASISTLPSGSHPSSSVPEEIQRDPNDGSANWILWLIGFSGAVSFGYEILFTRLLGHFLGGSVFAFATMLASFLAGITVGAALAGIVTQTSASARRWFVACQCLIGIFALVSWHSLEQFAGMINAAAYANEPFSIPRAMIAIIALLPPAIAIGATFPLAIRIHATSSADAAKSSALVYAVNTACGVAGALIVGYLVLPLTNYELTATVLVCCSLAIALLACLSAGLHFKHLIPMGIAVALLAILLPGQPTEILRISPFEGVYQPGELKFVRTGRSATVTVYNDQGSYHLLTGGLPEARTSPPGTLARPKGASPWLGALPTVLNPKAREMLIVGFGSGIAVANASSTLDSIDVFELEPGVIEANRRFSARRKEDPLRDPRVRVILNDGRSGLAMTSKAYDVIVSQPSHPWTAGASHLYTRQFAQLAHDHLNEEGLFIQWMDLNYLDLDLFTSLGATLLSVFEDVQLFQPNPNCLLFVGWKQPRPLPCVMPDLSNDQNRLRLRNLGVAVIEDLHALHVADRNTLQHLCNGGMINTDQHNRLALKKLPHDNRTNVLAIRDRIAKLAAESDPIGRCDGLNREYIARRQIQMGRRLKVQRQLEQQNGAAGLRVKAAVAHFDEQATLATELYQNAWDSDPSDESLIGLYLAERTLPGFNPKRFESEHADAIAAIPILQNLLEAHRALANGRFERLAELDPKLAAVAPQRIEFVEANLIRVRWRLVDPTAGRASRRGREAMDLLDQILPQVPVSLITFYRLEAALLAGRSDAVIESVRLIAVNTRQTLENQMNLGAQGRALLGSSLARCQQALIGLARRPGIDRERLAEVQALVTAVERQL